MHNGWAIFRGYAVSITSIYNQSWKTINIVMPIGLAANWVNWRVGQHKIGRALGLNGKHVERDYDTYSRYYFHDKAAVRTNELSPEQQKLLRQDKHFSRLSEVNLVSFYSLQRKNAVSRLFGAAKRFACRRSKIKYDNLFVRKREVFLNDDMYSKVLLENARDKAFNIHTLGQFWGNARPRAQGIEVINQNPKAVKAIAEIVRTRGTDKTPAAKFMIG